MDKPGMEIRTSQKPTNQILVKQEIGSISVSGPVNIEQLFLFQ